MRVCELKCWSRSFAGESNVVRCAKVGVGALSEDGSVGVRALWVAVRRGGCERWVLLLGMRCWG